MRLLSARWSSLFAALLVFTHVHAQQTIQVALSITSPGEIASDKTTFFYPADKATSDVLLVGNDGSATGGFLVFPLNKSAGELPAPRVHSTGRTKLVYTLYSLAQKDWIATLAQSDSYLRFFDVETETEIEDRRVKVWGDFSAMCGWRSAATGAQYLYIFGKRQVKIYLVRGNDDSLEVLEVQTAPVPIEAEGCTASQTSQIILFAGDDGNIYSFPASDNTTSPKVRVLLTGKEEIAGLTTYYGTGEEHLFVLYESSAVVFDINFQPVAKVELRGVEDYELNDLALYQGAIGTDFPQGAIALAIESDVVTGFAVASLGDIVSLLKPNTGFSPRDFVMTNGSLPRCETLSDCNGAGFCTSSSSGTVCQCFSGFTGEMCQDLVCTNDCSGHGSCTGPDICACDAGWDGPTCSFKVAHPKFETQENGEDGDDPAIWISPTLVNLSRVITTTKSDVGAGFAVFDLKGTKIQHHPAGEPNNVDIIYGFPLAERTVDLVYAACREDNTLCFAELVANGTLVDVPGSSQLTPEGFEVYGSCTYHSPLSNKFYLFVNAKDATYLQYELTSTDQGTLVTTLVRRFRGGTGGQVEGCVVDEPNGWLILGEEPYGLWRYSAEPPSDFEEGEEDDTAVGYLIDSIDGNLFADVEGVTLVYGSNSSAGLILVSCQGMSAYNIYKRAPPHEFVGQFTIRTSEDGQIDGVTNTDGIAAVGTALSADFPHGLVVVHDDVNEGPDGSINEQAAFKLVSLEDVLSDEILALVDPTWNPRIV